MTRQRAGLRILSRLRALTRIVLLLWLPWAAQARANALQDALANDTELAAAGLSLADAAALDRFQASRDYAPLFVDEGGATARGQSLVRALAAASDEGLEPADYNLTRLRRLATSADPAERASAELSASSLALRFARDLTGGRLVPREVMRDAVLQPPGIEVAAWLAALAASDEIGDALATQLPVRPRIAPLREALSRLRAEEATAPAWTSVPPGTALHPGDRDPRIPALQRGLIERGDLEAGASPAANADAAASPLDYDPPLVEAVSRFQTRHGLAPDGVVGAETIATLGISRARRIEQIAMNLERERWLDAEPGLHVEVNVPAFELEVFDGHQLRLRTRVIVGTRRNPTPIFTDQIGWIELNPAWNVPRSIALKEYADDLRRNPERMAARDYELVPQHGGPAIDPGAVDWAAVGTGFPFRLRQRPGSQNALGRVKFVFPNALAVYLHDTPSRALFERTARAFSHGCVRVQNPLTLAALLLGGEAGGWDEAQLAAAIDTGRRQQITLSAPVRVRLVYRTAFVDADGRLQLRADLYDRDARQLVVWSMTQRGIVPDARLDPPGTRPPASLGP